jgi:hypothetical protein
MSPAHSVAADAQIVGQQVNLIMTGDDPVDDIMSSILERGRESGVESLDGWERTVFLIVEVDATILIDSLLGLYDSRLGEYALEIVKALDDIGAEESATLIGRANSFFPGQSPPKDIDTRRDLLWNMDEGTLDTIGNLGQRFSDYPDGLQKLLARYVSEHASLAASRPAAHRCVDKSS